MRVLAFRKRLLKIIAKGLLKKKFIQRKNIYMKRRYAEWQLLFPERGQMRMRSLLYGEAFGKQVN